MPFLLLSLASGPNLVGDDKGRNVREPGRIRRPNFVFISTDDQRWDALGVVQREMGERGRFPWLETPSLDRLASEGARFRNAFVVTSLCSPGRASLLTGAYPHRSGIINNRTPFPRDAVTHATLLREAGYRTGYVGKWHMGSQSGRRPGFDYSASFKGQGRYHDCPFEVDGKRTETTGWVDDVSTDFALEFLKKNRDRPFSLVVGFKSSHGPWQPPQRWRGRLADVVARPAANAGAPAPYLRPPADGEGASRPADRTSARSEMHRNYFRTLSAIDENVGRILGALDEMGLAEDTAVVFTSDNGFYLGEHGLGDKRSAYEESIRVPLLVRYPRAVTPGSVLDEMALNIDLAPTLLDLAEVPAPASMQGRSWRPLLEGRTPPGWRKSFLYEYFPEERGPPAILAVRTEEAKLVQYPGHEEWTELYDLRADPFETANLARSPEKKPLLEAMAAELERQKRAADFRLPDGAGGPGRGGVGQR